jgi:hypothetical protein
MEIHAKVAAYLLKNASKIIPGTLILFLSYIKKILSHPNSIQLLFIFSGEEDSFYQQIGLEFEKETSKMLHLEHGFV